MAEAVRKKLRRQIRQVCRHMFEVRDANREHHSTGRESLARVEPQTKSVRHALQAGNHLVFQFGNLAVLECLPVRREGVEADRNPGVSVFNSALGTKMRQRAVAVGLVDVRGKAVRLETHPFGHVRAPAIHQPAKNAERYAATSEVRSD